MAELSIIQLIVHRMKAGLTFPYDEQDPHGDFLLDYLIVSDDPKDDTFTFFERDEKRSPPEGELREPGDYHWVLKKDLTAVEFRHCTGGNGDGSYVSGIDWEVDQVGYTDVLSPDVRKQIVKDVSDLLDDAEKRHGDWTAISVMTLWSYSTSYDAWNGDYDSWYDYIGVVNPKRLSAAVYEPKENKDVEEVRNG